MYSSKIYLKIFINKQRLRISNMKNSKMSNICFRTFVFCANQHLSQKNASRFVIYSMFGCGIPILMTLLIFLVDYFQVGSLLPAVGIFRCFLSTQGLNLIQTWKQDRVWKFVGLTLILVLKNAVLKNIGISKLKRSLEEYKFFMAVLVLRS